jgi:WD40 repeat protein
MIDSLRGEVVGSTVWAIAYSPNADLVATDVSGSGFRILLWKPGQDTPLRRLQGHDDAIRDLVFTPDGSRLVSASADGSVRVWNLETGATLCELKNHWDWVDSLDISADGSRLVSAGYDAVINIWDPDTCELLVALQDQYIIDGVAISPDGRLIAAGERDEAIHLFDDKGNLLRLLVGHEEWDVNDVDFSHQGDLLVSAGSDGTVRFWDPETGSILRVLPIGSEVTSARFSPDGHYVAVGSGMGEGVEVWGLPAP